MGLLFYLDAEGKTQTITEALDWHKRRADILANMQLVMGGLPDFSAPIPLDMEVLETSSMSGVIRKKVTFVSEPGDRMPAYLLIPKRLTGKSPSMLCLHQTTEIGKGEPAGLGGSQNLHMRWSWPSGDT